METTALQPNRPNTPQETTASPQPLHLKHWPPGLPQHLTLPETNLWFNVEVAAARYPDKPFIVFYDSVISFAEFKREAERIAGFLQQDCGVQAGDRVLLYMQNSPQWVLAFYAILRANAVVVPVNPMNRGEELRHYVADSGASTAFVAQDLLAQIEPQLGRGPAAPDRGDLQRPSARGHRSAGARIRQRRAAGAAGQARPACLGRRC